MKQEAPYLEASSSLTLSGGGAFSFAPADSLKQKRSYPKGRKMPEDWKLGERNAARKLTWLQAAEIRNAPRGYGKTKELAEKFGISRGMVRAIRRGDYWTFDRRKEAHP